MGSKSSKSRKDKQKRTNKVQKAGDNAKSLSPNDIIEVPVRRRPGMSRQTIVTFPQSLSIKLEIVRRIVNPLLDQDINK